MIRILFTILALIGSLSATTLTGTFKAPNGSRVNGSLVLTLSHPAVDTSTTPDESVTQQPITFKIVNGVPATLNGIGTPKVVGNDVMSPTGTVYYGVVRDYHLIAIRYGVYKITGSTFDIGAAIPTAVTTQNVSYMNVPTLGASQSWTGTNTFTQTLVVGSNISNSGTSGLTVAPGVSTGAGQFLTISGGAGAVDNTAGSLTATGGTGSGTGAGGTAAYKGGAGAGTGNGGSGIFGGGQANGGGNGGSTVISGGSALAGNGNGGDITFIPGNKSGAGTPGKIFYTAVTFANLLTPANGAFMYCLDCTIANPCAGGGTGAFAKRLNGIWVCN